MRPPTDAPRVSCTGGCSSASSRRSSAETHLSCTLGQFADSRGCKVHTFARPLRIELARRGLNGMHEGAPQIGKQYFVYLVGTKGGQAGAVISSEIAELY